MTILKLDAEAIKVLFPPGSPQTLDLQKCVIAEFAKKAWSARSGLPAGDITTVVNAAVREHVKSINDKLEETFRNVQTEKLTGLGYVTQTMSGSGWGRRVAEIKLNESVKRLIEAEAVSAVNGAVSSSIKSAIEAAVETKLKSGTVQHQIDVAVQTAINSAVIKQVQQALLKQGTNNA